MRIEYDNRLSKIHKFLPKYQRAKICEIRTSRSRGRYLERIASINLAPRVAMRAKLTLLFHSNSLEEVKSSRQWHERFALSLAARTWVSRVCDVIHHPEGPMIVARPRRVLLEEIVAPLRNLPPSPRRRRRHIFAKISPRFVRINVSHSTFRQRIGAMCLSILAEFYSKLCRETSHAAKFSTTLTTIAR